MKAGSSVSLVVRWLSSVLSVFIFVAYLPACEEPVDESAPVSDSSAGGKADETAVLDDEEIELLDVVEREAGTQALAEAWAARNLFEDQGTLVLPLPGNAGYLLLREESHRMGPTPCNPTPPVGPGVQHFNIEVQVCDVPGPGCSGQTIYNLHMAVWTDASGSPCYALWENQLSGPRCLAANCVPGASLDEVWDAVKQAAKAGFSTITEALQLILESAYNMHPVLARTLAISFALLIVVLIAIPPTGVPG